ncbi:MAG: hypothetical protein A2V93_07415 [Ignavibacteria bacterium RBG_16_34_14]|nr:MAG: hypothetical protein A2V93_07415 [Ignavibacteria bacterium RBG_16_34_14]
MKLNVVNVLIPIIAIVFIFALWVLFAGQSPIIQPISYNHKVHIEEAGLECIDCHKYAESMTRASIPNIDLCEDCHGDEPISKSPEEKKLIEFIEQKQNIPWKQIYSVPDHVYFSHRRHVVIGELNCSNCHGNVSELTAPAQYPFLIPSMGNCIDCHKQLKITNDCLACHF